MIHMIVAVARSNRAIGKNNKLLWRLPQDMTRFKKITQGHVVIMGRKTWESIPLEYRPLSSRTNIIISRNSDYRAPGAHIAHDIASAIEYGEHMHNQDLFIIGGSQIYEETLPYIDKLYITLVDGEFQGDTFFPEFETKFPHIIQSEKGIDNGIHYEFQIRTK
jgi:dihydrofolate reductase